MFILLFILSNICVRVEIRRLKKKLSIWSDHDSLLNVDVKAAHKYTSSRWESRDRKKTLLKQKRYNVKESGASFYSFLLIVYLELKQMG